MGQHRTRAFLFAVAATLTLVTGYAQQAAVSSVSPNRRATPPVAAPPASVLGPGAPDGAARMVEGITLDFRFRGGSLSIAVERTVPTVGVERLRLVAQRTGPCGAHKVDKSGSLVDCPVVWSVDRTVRGTLHVDAQLATAIVNARLRGQPLRIRTDSSGEPDAKSNPDGGPLLVTTRETRAAARWGSHRWAWPSRFSARDAGTGLTYRRYE